MENIVDKNVDKTSSTTKQTTKQTKKKSRVVFNIFIKVSNKTIYPNGYKAIAGYKEATIEYYTTNQLKYLLTLEARKMFPKKIKENDFVEIDIVEIHNIN